MSKPAAAPLAPLDLNRLKAEAEARLAGNRTDKAEAPVRSTEEILYELMVYQIELDMQNETLRQTQAALEESRDQYRDLYEFAPIGYLTLDAQGRIEAINFTGAKLLGENRKKLLRRQFVNFITTEKRDEWRKSFLQAVQHGVNQTCQLTLQGGDGATFVTKLECRPDAIEGAVKTLHVTLTDISDLQRAMSETQRREDRLKLAKAAMDFGVYDDDLGSNHMVDERVREIWGFAPNEAVTVEQIIAGVHPDDRAGMRTCMERALEPGGDGSYAAEYRVINRSDGGVRHVAANGQVVFRDGKAIRFVGTVRDVSAQKQLEQEAREQRAAMELLLNKQVAVQTAAAFAHELNQPLLSISAYSEVALRLLRGGAKDPERLKHAIEGAMQQAQRAGTTLRELLGCLSKSEVPVKPVELAGVLHDALECMNEDRDGRYYCAVDLEPDLPPVLANHLQLQKILTILLQNSIDAMRAAGMRAGSVAITVRRQAGKNMAQVTVRDSGPGLDAVMAERVFEPFFTSKADGMGLGLGISRSLVESFGGRMWAEPSAPGATFHFTIPFAP